MKQCPKCKEELTHKEIGGIEVDECPTCKGVWYEKDELRQAKDTYDSDLNWMDFEILKHKDQFKSTSCVHLCPTCQEPMVSLEYGKSKVIINYCQSCQGTWLDKGEFKKIIDELELELLTKSFPSYIKETIKEGAEIITGHESLISEWKDFANVLRFMQYRLFVENPKLLDAVTRVQANIQ
jgi:Zn-finger nucleic acid-binding protein